MTVETSRISPSATGRTIPVGLLWSWATVLTALLLIPLARVWELAPDLGHGWAAPILMGYLWWERWESRPDIRVTPATVGAGGWVLLGIVVFCAVPLRLLLTPYPLWPVALILYLSVLVGLILYGAQVLAGRAGVHWLLGPMSLLLGVLPWPGVIERVLILPLREGIATLVAEISNVMGHPALASGTSVRLANGWVGIDEACGGIRSLQAAVTTALFFGEWLQLSGLRRLALILGGGVFAVIGNLGRVLFLAWCARAEAGMLDRWHDAAGWAALGFSLVMTGWLGWYWRQKGSNSTSAPVLSSWSNRSVGSGGSFRLWLVLSLAGMLLIEIGTRWWYVKGTASGMTGPSNWTVQLPEHIPSYQPQPLTTAAEEMLRPDAFTSGYWYGSDGIQRSANYIEWHTGQVARSAPFLHNPTICLPYAGCELVEELGVVNVYWEGIEIPFHTYIFRRMNEDMVVAFTIWDPSRGQPLEARGASWWRAQWRDVREARRDQPARLLSFAFVGRIDPENLVAELASILSRNSD